MADHLNREDQKTYSSSAGGGYRELVSLTDHTIKHEKTRKPGATHVSDPDQKKDHSHRAKGQALKF